MKKERFDFLKEHIDSIQVDFETGSVIDRAVFPSGNGYLQCTVNKKTYAVHEVIMVKLGHNLVGKLTINHEDGIITNNRPENLTVMTYKENTEHAWRTGLVRKRTDFTTSPRGETHPKAILTRVEANEIYDLANSRLFTQVEIGDIYGIDRTVVSRIKNRKLWFNG